MEETLVTDALIITTGKEASVKRRGRPIGKNRRALSKWQPKKWKPLYEEVVALHCAGKSNTQIAILKQLTAQQVSNIITCDKGIEVQAEIIKGIRARLGTSIDDRVGSIIDKAVSRTHQLINNDDAFSRNPIAVIKAAVLVGKATGNLTGDNSGKDSSGNSSGGNTTINHNTLNVIGAAGLEQLQNAVRASDEARRLNSGTSK